MSVKVVKDRIIGATRFIAGGVFAVLMLMCTMNVVLASQQINTIAITGRTGDIEIKDSGINGLAVAPELVFHKIGDSVTYRIGLSNPEMNKYQIKNISDNNTNENIKISYDYDNSMTSADKAVYITIRYEKYIEFGESVAMDDVNITFEIEEEAYYGVGPTNDNGDISEVGVPNTGSVAKYFDNSKAKKNVLFWAATGLLSVSIFVIVIVAKEKRLKVGVMVFLGLVSFSGTFLVKEVCAETQNFVIKFSNSKVSALPDTSDLGNSVTVTFPNIYYDSSIYGNSYFIKTLDGKYVMFDTGLNDEKVRNTIYNALKIAQGSKKIVIDYLVLSHLDEDHQGNVITFFNDENFTIKNIILKKETWSNTRINQFNNITATAVAKGAKVFTNFYSTQSGFNQIKDGDSIQIGKYLTLTFFNVANVYEGKSCSNGKVINWTASTTTSSKFVTEDNKYVYFDGKNYPNIELKTTDTIIQKIPDWATGVGVGLDRYFYATIGNGNSCASNADSFGILAEVKTIGKSRYMYLPGDLENGGYDTLFNSGSNSPQIFDNVSFSNGEFKTDITPFKISSEKTTAEKIKNKLLNDSASTEDIVIYQETHHGINNDTQAVNTLGLNRESGIYAIQEGVVERIDNTGFNYTKSYYYTLGKIPSERKIRVGTYGKSGVICTINILGDTLCDLK